MEEARNSKLNKENNSQRRVFVVRIWQESQQKVNWRGEIKLIGESPNGDEETIRVSSTEELLTFFIHQLLPASDENGLK